MEQERALDANSMTGDPPDGESSGDPTALHCNDRALERLGPHVVALDNPDCDPDHIAGAHFGQVLF
jgi:hypothetical protein